MKCSGTDNFTKKEREILQTMGFSKNTDGKYYHHISEKYFDFSALSIQGVIYQIYMEGFKSGVKTQQNKLLEVLGVKK